MGLAKREMPPGVEHRQHSYLNNRAENSHQPTRQRERRMGRFKSPGHAQRLLSAYGPIASHFRPRRHRLPAPEYRQPDGATIPYIVGDHGYGPRCVSEEWSVILLLLDRVIASRRVNLTMPSRA